VEERAFKYDSKMLSMCFSATSCRMTVLRQRDKTKLVSKEAVWPIQTAAYTFYEMHKADVTSEELHNTFLRTAGEKNSHKGKERSASTYLRSFASIRGCICFYQKNYHYVDENFLKFASLERRILSQISIHKVDFCTFCLYGNNDIDLG
jgi:predicted ATP-grasp superfamily ATP-dependent carboligase